MEKQAFVSVSIVTVAGVCEATGLPFVWVFVRTGVHMTADWNGRQGCCDVARGRFNLFL